MSITKEEFETGRSEYYAMCGWDTEGHPTQAKLDELGDEKGLLIVKPLEV